MNVKATYTLCLIMVTGLLLAQPKFELVADTNRIMIGGQVKLEIRAQLDADAELKWPLLKDSLASFEIVKVGTLNEELKGGIKYLKQELWVTSFDSGYAFIPALQAQADDQLLESQAIGVFVGMPEVNEEEDYFDIKEPLDPPINWVLVGLIVLSLAVIGIGLYFLISWLQKRSEKPEILTPEAGMSPYEWAQLRLKKLKEDELWNNGKVKEYYSEVTQILRQYLESEMGKPALESTADEVMDIIKDLRPHEDLYKKCQNLMDLSVGVKFAKLKPIESDHISALSTLEEFLEAYKPKEVDDVSVSV